jgi:hypothetical protein
MDVSRQIHALVTLTQGKNLRYPLDGSLGGHQSRSGRGIEEKNSQSPPGIEPRSSDLQPVASRYTDWAMPANPEWAPQEFLIPSRR